MMRIISLGWGVQSFTLVSMVALKELPLIDYAVHANTTHEFSGTYEFAKKWTPWLEEHGVKVVTVRNPQPPQELMSLKTDIPAYTFRPEHFIESDGWEETDIKNENGELITEFHPELIGKSVFVKESDGQLRRQCTGDWKIAPMRRFIQAHRNGTPVEQWIGISRDESQRMKDSDVKYITHRWPLIEKRMTRNDCIAWLKAHDLEVPPRSACTFCPFHSTREWQHIKASPMDWEEAIKVDNEIRRAYLPQEMFLHRSLKPLEDVDLRTEEERGQIMFDGWDSECSGICGV
jgi:3'-phosphoadenosine 5'-phosphosulfate sulfotransferase (PAPS reductase)/FAD synthetase